MGAWVRIAATFFAALGTATLVTFSLLKMFSLETQSSIFWATLIYPVIMVAMVVATMRIHRVSHAVLWVSAISLVAAVPVLTFPR